MPDLEQAADRTAEQRPAAGRHFMRFTRAQRYLHAVLFTTFLDLPGPVCLCVSARASGRVDWLVLWADLAPFFFFHKLCAIVLTGAFLVHVKDIFTRGVLHREKGNLLGFYLHGGQLEGCEGPIRTHALVSGSRSQTAV